MCIARLAAKKKGGQAEFAAAASSLWVISLTLDNARVRPRGRKESASNRQKKIREYGLSLLAITNMEAGGSVHIIASFKIIEQLGFANREQLLFNGQPAIRFFDEKDCAVVVPIIDANLMVPVPFPIQHQALSLR